MKFDARGTAAMYSVTIVDGGGLLHFHMIKDSDPLQTAF